MPMPKVWSEREYPAWRDCVYSSGLMLLVAGGKISYPLGLYTDAEREALERSDDRPDETGANFPTLDTAVRRRYGVLLRPLQDGSRAGLAWALSATGGGLAIAGRLSNFPAGHSLRRYSPNFTGFHAVCVIPLGGGYAWWLDPLAPNLYAGERVTVADVLTFATYPNDARALYAEELSPMATVTVTKYPAWRTWYIAGGATVVGLKPGSPNKPFTAGSGGSSAAAVGPATVAPLPAGWPQDELRLVANGALQGYLIRAATPGLTWDELLDPVAAAAKAAAHAAAVDVRQAAADAADRYPA